jgi:hypothetical protein
MYDPYDEWMIIYFDDNWEIFNGELKNGLYMVETLDYS